MGGSAAEINAPGSKRSSRALIVVSCFLGAWALFAIFHQSQSHGIKREPPDVVNQQARQIGTVLFCYSTDNTANHNRYPDGKSSTEVFQNLIDSNYVNDPDLFYFPLPGKVKPVPGQKLKPENVSFDVTSGVDSSSPDVLPIVFLTGYRVTYAPGGSAVPLVKIEPQFYAWPRTWSEWWRGNSIQYTRIETGIWMMYKGNNAVHLNQDSDGTIRNIIPPDFKPDGRNYRQLTPDGLLPQ
jgi:hypothetical protein